MSMKPCTFEQDLLFSLHHLASPLMRMRLFFHCLGCESCRERRAEFAQTTELLSALRPAGGGAYGSHMRAAKSGRLVVCLAILGLMAAAYSYYSAFGPEWLWSRDAAASNEPCPPPPPLPDSQQSPPGSADSKKAKTRVGVSIKGA